jgi:beta-mannosidase
MTCGPYRPITLKTYVTRIVDIHPRASVDAALSPSLKVDISLEGSVDTVKALRLELTNAKTSKTIKAIELALEDVKAAQVKGMLQAVKDAVGGGSKEEREEYKQVVDWDLKDDGVQVWWPVGYGDQNLYNLKVDVIGVSSLAFTFLYVTERNSAV